MTSHTNKKLSKNKRKKIINQIDLVPIKFGVLISKERNSEKARPKKNDIRQKNMYVRILVDSSTSALIMHESYVNKNNFITMKTSTNKLSTMAGSFSTTREAGITLKMPEHDFTAPFCAISRGNNKKSNF